MGPRDTQDFVFYTNKWSLPSNMLRFAMALRGEVENGSVPITIEEREVDIIENMEHLGEEFILHVNPKGQIPVFINSEVFPEPLTESLDIVKFLMSRYPSLRPPEQYSHESQELLNELHGLNHFLLCFAHTPVLPESTVKNCKWRLANASSPEYRKALEYKLDIYKAKSRKLTRKDILDLDKKTMQFLDKIRAVMSGHDGPWIYGKHGPSALDAHTIVFLHVMKEAGHWDYFDPVLDDYLHTGTGLPQWNSVPQGHPLLPYYAVATQEQRSNVLSSILSD